MSYKETIESFIYDYPILEFHYLDRKDLILSLIHISEPTRPY